MSHRLRRSRHRSLLFLLPFLLFAVDADAAPRKRAASGKARTTVAVPAPKPPPVQPEPLVTLPPPTAKITPEDGWKLIYAGGSGQGANGSLPRLLELARDRGNQLGVAFAAFDGQLSGVCTSISIGSDGIVDCEAEIWCNQPNVAGVPDRHGHSAHLRSDGSVTYAVITLNERGERKILGLGDSDALVAWYTR